MRLLQNPRMIPRNRAEDDLLGGSEEKRKKWIKYLLNPVV